MEVRQRGKCHCGTTAKGQEYTYSYGAFNVLTGIQRPSGRQLELRYNSDGRLVEVENEAHETYRYEYNTTGQVIGEEDFSGRRLGYDFDLSGFCIKRVNGLGEVIEISRDACGRVIRKLASDGEETTFEYDVYGRYTKAVNASSEVVFERDEFGRILKEIQNGRGVESEYDERGLRLRRKTAYGADLGLSYDANGLLIALEAGGDEVLRFSRDVMGRETDRHSRGGFSLLQQYDPVHRLIGQWVGSAGVGVVERRYKYDGNDNPVEIDDSSWGRSRFEFDEDDRVNAARHEKGGDEQFTYEPTGNVAASLRLTFGRPPRGDAKIGWQTHFYSKGGRLEQRGDTRYFYDADNRIVEKHDAADRWRYQWSAEGRLVSVRRPDGEVWRYSYDAFGRRVRKQGPRGATNYLWDERVIAEETVEGEAPVSWVFEPESFRPLLKQQAGQAYPCVTDHGGTPRELMTTDGRVAWSARLSVWGDAEESVSRTDCHLRFQGQWSDEESGLHYNWVRYYDPDSEVYISPDPIGFNGGPRLHGYVDNPLTWIDPMGLTGDPATATHITYVGIKDGLPYVGYASMPGDKTGLEVLNYRYSNNFDAFETEPRVVYRGYGMEGKQTARGLEQRIFDDYGGLGKTANRQNPVGPGNANRDTYLAKADAYRAANAADEGVNPRVNRAVNRTC